MEQADDGSLTKPHRDSTANPYIGPRPFGREQANRFFGREGEARDLEAEVRAFRFVWLFAQSGAGKSSLIEAGLKPRLEKKAFAYYPTARVSGPVPRNLSGIKNIFAFHLMRSLHGEGSDGQIFARLSIAQFLSKLVTDDGISFQYDPAYESVGESPESEPPHLLIIDQFEELLTHHGDRWKIASHSFNNCARCCTQIPNSTSFSHFVKIICHRWNLMRNRSPHIFKGDSIWNA